MPSTLQRRRSLAVGVFSAVLVLFVVSACTSGEGGAEKDSTARPTEGEPFENPEWKPLDRGTPASRDPAPLSGAPSKKQLTATSQAGPTRSDAEEFALQFANFYLDVRPELNDEDIVDEFGARTIDPKVKTFIIEEKRGQRELGTGRKFDTSVPMWIRSLPDGPDEAPERVAVEIAGNGVAPGLDFRTWLKIRVDVVRTSSGWRVESLSTATDGPMSVKVLDADERRSYLTGAGWRELRVS
ncbi:MAG: hypothetical protein NTV28_06830 [Propionibacteriales bacterium]|nr:hypothetical protein [Propionibacteriales bacterium]